MPTWKTHWHANDWYYHLKWLTDWLKNSILWGSEAVCKYVTFLCQSIHHVSCISQPERPKGAKAEVNVRIQRWKPTWTQVIWKSWYMKLSVRTMMEPLAGITWQFGQFGQRIKYWSRLISTAAKGGTAGVTRALRGWYGSGLYQSDSTKSGARQLLVQALCI